MPLARFSLYAQGIEVYVAATWDEGDGWLASMRHIALEGRCWVLGAGCAIKASDVPADFPGRAQLYPDPEKWLNSGDSSQPCLDHPCPISLVQPSRIYLAGHQA